MATITTLTLTYNEESNIRDCLESFASIAQRMIVLDGFSADNTVEIAKSCGAEVFQKKCGYYDRFIFGLNTIPIDTDWILFIDADERMTEESCNELISLCNKYADSDVNGIVVNYRINFMGRDLKHGGSILRKLRVFKPNMAFMENIKLDQHIRLKYGKLVYMKSFLLHKDYKGIASWSKKHVDYAEWAAKDYMLKKEGKESIELSGLETAAKIKRILKYNFYYRLPMGFRAWLFYFYRYYIRLGFLDGKEGKIYTYLHAYWYRFLVDAMIYDNREKRI